MPTNIDTAKVKNVFSEYLPWLALACALCLFLWNLVTVWQFTMDDAFIYLRYAENLAYHGTLDFNFDGEMNEGFTTFLYTVLIAAVRFLGGDPVLELKILGLFFTAGTCVALAMTIRRLAPTKHQWVMPTIWACIVFLAYPATPFHAITGMETSLFTFCLSLLCLGWADARLRPTTRSYALFGIASLLTGLCRPDGNLPALILAADLFFRSDSKRRFLIAWCAGFVLPGLVYFVWRYKTYGLLFPAPFYVKVGGAGSEFRGIDDVTKYVSQIAWLTLCIPILGVWLRRQWAALAVVVVLYCAFYLKPIHNMGYESRFVYPMTPLILMLGALALMPRKKCAIVSAVLSLVIATVLGIERRHGDYQEWLWYEGLMQKAVIPLGQDLGRYREQFGDTWIATGDAGAIPYYSGLSTIDVFGLNNKKFATSGYSADYLFGRDLGFLTLVSARRDRYVKAMDNEAFSLRDALARGYRLLAIYTGQDNYHYLIIGKGEKQERFYDELRKQKPELTPPGNFDFGKL